MIRAVWPKAVAGRIDRRALAPALLGFGLWIGFPTVGAYQDIGSLVSGTDTAQARWSTFVQRSVAGSVQAADMPFSSGDQGLSGAGREAPGIGAIAFRDKGSKDGGAPDEDRVVRGDKRGRLLRVAPMAPPRNFSAGSVFERTSGLLRPAIAPEVAMAFAKPAIQGKEEVIASAFHPKAEKPASEPGMPALLASLVNGAKADVLATAYAPAAPDYAKTSPFESLLRDEPAGGRFIPPLEQGDHAWMATPLPASVFSAEEQKCLATGIYFEARGESLRGQAAVAQVILNRVRNPAYPKSICGVVYQNKRMRNACQFSFACDNIKDRITSPGAYRTAEDVGLAVTAGKIFLPEVASSTHYYADYVSPRWARAMEKMKKIGRHIFFRTYGGGWS